MQPPTLLTTITLALLFRSTTAESSSQHPEGRDPQKQWLVHPSPGPTYPTSDPYIKRALHARELFSSRTPTGVRKMGTDPDEMFFLEYWDFGPDEAFDISPKDPLHLSPRAYFGGNSTHRELLQPVRLHEQSPNEQHLLLEIFRRGLQKRFKCPDGYNDCGEISRPNVCCPTGQTCISVPSNNAAGNVGCCPGGSDCGNIIGNCDTAAGFHSCPGDSSGGCCIPNFQCFETGCISRFTSTTTTTLPTATVIGCSPGSYLCDSSLGGGCCATDSFCFTSGTCLSTEPSTTLSTTPSTAASPTAAASPGVLRTGGTTSTDEFTVPSTLTTGTSIIAVCPTGYYFCSAYYIPGCCRVGRNCSFTNCPAATASSTIVANGVTIVVPAGGSTGGSSYVTTALLTGARAQNQGCPQAWYLCPPAAGGECCPNEFECGPQSCSSVGPETTSVRAKVAASARSEVRWGVLVGAAVLGGLGSGWMD